MIKLGTKAILPKEKNLKNISEMYELSRLLNGGVTSET